MSRQRKEKNTRTSSKDNKEFTQVLNYIEKQLKYWAEYPIDKLAKVNGHAYIVADTIRKSKVENSQLRKFYHEAQAGFAALMHPKRKDTEKALTTLAMLVPRAYYAKDRGSISDEFLDFLKAALHVEKFRSKNTREFENDYKRFMEFFEAVVGYHKYL